MKGRMTGTRTDHIFSDLFDDVRNLQSRGAVFSAPGTGGTLEYGLNQFLIEGQCSFDDLLKDQHFPPGVQGRTEG